MNAPITSLIVLGCLASVGCGPGAEPAATTPAAAEPAPPTPAPSPSAPAAPSAIEHELAEIITASGFPGVFAASSQSGRLQVCVGCDDMLPPASTFKVPHALIAIELGVASPDTEMAWDGVERSISAWNRDHTLASAIQYSAVWYFRRLAPQIGRARMQRALDQLDYGNRTIGAQLDGFWLDASLRVSPRQQVNFWHRLHDLALPASPATHRQVLAMVELERSDDAVLRGKTGWYQNPRDAQQIGWLTGCVLPATDDHGAAQGDDRGAARERVCFALALRAREPFDGATFSRARFEVTGALLRHLGLADLAGLTRLSPRQARD
ncbi:MAG: hypothetical protein Tsb0020_19860 [Haliangiales bacterium]